VHSRLDASHANVRLVDLHAARTLRTLVLELVFLGWVQEYTIVDLILN
jgi:hypothetical protein